MPRSYKDEMLKIVKAKFELLLGKEPYILKSINKKWRNWKSYVKSLNFDPNIPIEQQMLDIPSRVDEDQYKALVKHWMSDKSKKISEKNKQTRAKLELLHRMGKKSFAIKKRLGRYSTRAELFEECYYRPGGSLTSEMIRESIEQMKEVAEQEQETECSNDNDCLPNLNDAYAKIMGQDKHGYLRMYGMGVTPADVCGAIPSCDASYRLAMEYKSKYMEAVEKFDALNANVESLSALVNGRAQSVGQVDVQNIPLSSSNNQRSSALMSRPMRIRVHSRVVLKSLGNINEIVASGYVSEMDNIKVNGEELGSDWCEIIIQSQMKKDVRLLRPYGNIQTIEDTLGVPVAWLSLVVLDENFD